MAKFLIIFISAMLSVSVDAEFRSECQLSSPFKIQLNETKVIFHGHDQPLVIFDNNSVAVNGNVLELTVSQQYKAASFDNRVRRVLSLANSVAEKAGTLAVNSMTLVSRTLLQLDDQDHALFMAPINALVDQVRSNVTEERFNPAALRLEFGDVLESSLKASFYFVVEEASAKIFSVFSDAANAPLTLGPRIDQIEKGFEALVLSDLTIIEAEVNLLCYELQQLDTLDRAFEGFQGYPSHGLIQSFESEQLNDLESYARLLQPGALEALLSF